MRGAQGQVEWGPGQPDPVVGTSPQQGVGAWWSLRTLPTHAILQFFAYALKGKKANLRTSKHYRERRMWTFCPKYIKKSDRSLLTQLLCIYTYLTTLEPKSPTIQMLGHEPNEKRKKTSRWQEVGPIPAAPGLLPPLGHNIGSALSGNIPSTGKRGTSIEHKFTCTLQPCLMDSLLTSPAPHTANCRGC